MNPGSPATSHMATHFSRFYLISSEFHDGFQDLHTPPSFKFIRIKLIALKPIKMILKTMHSGVNYYYYYYYFTGFDNPLAGHTQ
jgi:hypothetical protein